MFQNLNFTGRYLVKCANGSFFLESAANPNIILTVYPNDTVGAGFRQPVPVNGSSPQLFVFVNNKHIISTSTNKKALTAGSDKTLTNAEFKNERSQVRFFVLLRSVYIIRNSL